MGQAISLGLPEDFTGVVDNEEKTVYYKDGNFHREDGPAYVEKIVDGLNSFRCSNSGFGCYQAWWVNGKRHRVDGPAIIYGNGDFEFCLNGIKVSPMEVFELLSDERKAEVIWELDSWVSR